MRGRAGDRCLGRARSLRRGPVLASYLGVPASDCKANPAEKHTTTREPSRYSPDLKCLASMREARDALTFASASISRAVASPSRLKCASESRRGIS